MPTTSFRRLFAVLLATVLGSVAALTVTAAPAHAAVSGNLLVKGSGSVYSDNFIVNQGVVPGAPARSWGFKLVNTSTEAQQFKIVKVTYGSGMTATLYRGSTALPNTFYTAPIAPGGSLLLTLKISIAAGSPQGEYVAGVQLRDPETNNTLEEIFADANATYQTGTTRNDLLVKSGTQPYVGGSGTQYTSSNALKPGNIATFILRLQNNGGTASTINLNGPGSFLCPGAWTWTVKQGTQDVTAAVDAGAYSATLAPGARRDLKLSVKLLNAGSCTADYFYFEASGPDASVLQAAHVLVAG